MSWFSDTGKIFTLLELSYLKRRILLDFLDFSIRNADVISTVHHRNLILLIWWLKVIFVKNLHLSPKLHCSPTSKLQTLLIPTYCMDTPGQLHTSLVTAATTFFQLFSLLVSVMPQKLANADKRVVIQESLGETLEFQRLLLDCVILI